MGKKNLKKVDLLCKAMKNNEGEEVSPSKAP